MVDKSGFRFCKPKDAFLNSVNHSNELSKAVANVDYMVPLRNLVRLTTPRWTVDRSRAVKRIPLSDSSTVELLRSAKHYENANIVIDNELLHTRTLCMQTTVTAERFLTLSDDRADCNLVESPGHAYVMRAEIDGETLAALYLPPIMNYFNREKFNPALANLESLAEAKKRMPVSIEADDLTETTMSWIISRSPRIQVQKGFGPQHLLEMNLREITDEIISELDKLDRIRGRENAMSNLDDIAKGIFLKVRGIGNDTRSFYLATMALKAVIDIQRECSDSKTGEPFLEHLLSALLRYQRSLHLSKTTPVNEAFLAEHIWLLVYKDLHKSRYGGIEPGIAAQRILNEAYEDIGARKVIPVIKDGHHRAISSMLMGWSKLRFVKIRESTEAPSSVPTRLMYLRLTAHDTEKAYKYPGIYESEKTELSEICADA